MSLVRYALQEAAKRTPLAFKRYIDGFLDTLLPDERVVDRLGKPEVCFLGPDEHTGTGGLMDWGAEHAKRRGAWFWKVRRESLGVSATRKEKERREKGVG